MAIKTGISPTGTLGRRYKPFVVKEAFPPAGRGVPNTFKSAAFSQETDEAFLVLIKIDHDDFSESIPVSSDGVNTISNGETFVAYPFEISLPSNPETGISQAHLSIENVSQDIIDSIRNISTPPSVVIQIVLASDPDTIEVEFSGFELRNVSYDALTITGTLTIESFMSEPYPGDSFLPSTFPGLF